MGNRTAAKSRVTKETKVEVSIDLDGTGQHKISTGLGFFDHMLEQLSHHSKIDMEIKAEGDLYVDGHHMVEDVGIVLGKTLAEGIGDKGKVARYGSALIPMDESLASVAIDISGRPYLYFDCPFKSYKVGDFETALVEEFFRALTTHGGITAHIQLIRGKNDHHKIEGIFKSFAFALREAVRPGQGISSTKGMIENE